MSITVNDLGQPLFIECHLILDLNTIRREAFTPMPIVLCLVVPVVYTLILLLVVTQFTDGQIGMEGDGI